MPLEKIQKIIAESGLCSRRAAEKLILSGHVKINNKTAKIGDRAMGASNILVNDKKLPLFGNRTYILLNKPVGYVCTNKKFKNEKSVLGLIDAKERLFVAGRLDKNSEGLVLLTNDGQLCLELTHPRYGHEKTYLAEVRASHGLSRDAIIRKFQEGIDIKYGDGVVKAEKIRYLGENKFEIVLREGKKRQIRRMFEALACDVVSLRRIKLGKAELGDLPLGKWKKVSRDLF